MRWDEGHESPDVVDRRGQGGGGGGLGLGLLFWIGSRFGVGGILVAVAIFFVLRMFSGASGLLGGTAKTSTGQKSDTKAQFVGFVLDDAQDTWSRRFAAEGQKYARAKLVLFEHSTQSGCGRGTAEVGPFYCPLDQRVYIDLSFYRELSQRFGAPGDFAQAYVIAHEIGHHVQTLTGISDRVQNESRRNPSMKNALSVRQELQADCFAGLWGHDTNQRQVLEQGDLDEALRAAAAIGDDRLQKGSTGTVSPETFTHGTSAQRVKWFRRGFESGKIEACDTFAGEI